MTEVDTSITEERECVHQCKNLCDLMVWMNFKFDFFRKVLTRAQTKRRRAANKREAKLAAGPDGHTV